MGRRLFKIAVVVYLMYLGLALSPFGWVVRFRCSVGDPSVSVIRCNHTLTLLGLQLQLYADLHDGRFPASLDELLLENNMMEMQHECDAVRTPSPTTAPGSARPVVTSYRYYGAGLTRRAPATSLLIVEPPENHRTGSNVLYAEGKFVSCRRTKRGNCRSRQRSSRGATLRLPSASPLIRSAARLPRFF